MRRWRQAPVRLVALAALAMGACECSVQEPPSPGDTPGSERGPAAAAPEPVQAPEHGCAAGRPSILATSGERYGSVAVALSGERALVVHPDGEGALMAWPTDPAGTPLGEPAVVALPHPRALIAFEAVGPRFVVISTGDCPDDVEGRLCSFARALTADGEALGGPVAVGHGVPRSLRVRASSDALYVVRSAQDGSTELDRFEPTVRGLEHERVALGEDRGLDGEHVEVLGLAVEGERWAAVWRVGATDDPDSEVWVGTPEGEVRAPALHDALVLEQLRLSDEGLDAIAAFEMSRPKLVRLGRDGQAMAEAELPAGAPIPEPFADLLRAGVSFADGTLSLRLRNGTGDRLDTVRLLGSSNPDVPHVGDVTRSGNGFLVAFTGPEANGYAVGTTRVQCAPR